MEVGPFPIDAGAGVAHSADDRTLADLFAGSRLDGPKVRVEGINRASLDGVSNHHIAPVV